MPSVRGFVCCDQRLSERSPNLSIGFPKIFPGDLVAFSPPPTRMARHVRDVQPEAQGRNVLEFDMGVRVYPPSRPDGYWRLRWEERRRAKDTTARDRASAIAKANEIVERLVRSSPTELGRARGADLVAHYLDPKRRPPRVSSWSIR